MRLRFTTEARADIASIYTYIRRENPSAADRVADQIEKAALGLREYPHLGHQGALPGTRELVLRNLPFIVVYSIDPEADLVIVLNVFHGARDRGTSEV